MSHLTSIAAVARNGVIGADEAFEFPDLTAAVEQAKTVLGEMALDGLPSAPTNMIEIEVQDFGNGAVSVKQKLRTAAAPSGCQCGK